MLFRSDTMLSGADCRIEWRGGGVERALGNIENTLSELIARRFPSGRPQAEG